MPSGWYNDNNNRSYPFLDSSTVLPIPNSVLTDFGCVIGPDISYDCQSDVVYLSAAIRTQSEFVFEFSCSSPDLADKRLVFHVDEQAVPGTIIKGSTTLSYRSSSALSSAVRCDDIPDWEGYIVIGDIKAIEQILDVGEQIVNDSRDHAIEPTLIQSLNKQFLRTVNLANAPRTVVDPPDGCGSVQYSLPPDQLIVSARCIAGEVKFAEGFNCYIRLSTSENSLTFSGAVGYGAGEPCSEVRLSSSELSPDGGTFLSGGPSCSDLILSINGLTGKNFRLVAGRGIRIERGVEPNKLIISTRLATELLQSSITV